MAIPLATTTITIRRVPADPTADGYEQPAPQQLATGVRAHLSTPGGSQTIAGTTATVDDRRLTCDPTDLVQGDLVVDAGDGLEYLVEWAAHRPGVNGRLAHVEAGLRRSDRAVD